MEMYQDNQRRRGAAIRTFSEQDNRSRVLGLMAAIIPAAAILVACASILSAFS